MTLDEQAAFEKLELRVSVLAAELGTVTAERDHFKAALEPTASSVNFRDLTHCRSCGHAHAPDSAVCGNVQIVSTQATCGCTLEQHNIKELTP